MPIERRYRLTLEGLTPLLMNKPLPAPTEEVRDKDAYDRAHWLDKAYRAPDGAFIVQREALMRMSVEGAGFYMGKKPSGVKKGWGTLVEAAVVVEEDLRLTAPDPALDSRLVKANPSDPKSGRVIRHKPRFDLPWGGTVHISVFDEVLTEAHLGEIFARGGAMVGLLDGRRKLKTGRCRITVEAVT